MSLKQTLIRGDVIRAESTSGSVIIGQATHDMTRSGSSILRVAVGDDNGRGAQIDINVNFWDVTTVYRNVLLDLKP